MKNDIHHARLVLATVREQWDEAALAARFTALDGDLFVEQCRECDVHPWAHHLLTTAASPAWMPAPAMARLERLRAKVRQDNLLLLARAEQALDVLRQAGVTPVALKGLDFLHRIYPSFDQRTIDDVDLLIRREELEVSLAALRRAGWRLPPEDEARHYVRSSHHLPLRSPGELAVDFEIHWNLAQSGRYHIDVDALFDRAAALDVGGRTALRLDDHDVVAHLLLHHFSHYFDRRLKWLVDLRLLATSAAIDWSTVGERVRSWNGAAAAAVSLVHLRKLAPELIPDRALRLLPWGAWRRALTAPLRSSHPLELFRGTRRRGVQLYLASVMLQQPARLPGWLLHRGSRDRTISDHPLDRAPIVGGEGEARTSSADHQSRAGGS